MSCEHRFIAVLAGTAKRIRATPLKVCTVCGALKVNERIVSPGLDIEEMPQIETEEPEEG
jgi:hypothetical protein